jgi:hypothetical protein
MSRGQRGGSPTVVNLSFLDRRMSHTVEFLFLINFHKRKFSESRTNREEEVNAVREPQFGNVCNTVPNGRFISH